MAQSKEQYPIKEKTPVWTEKPLSSRNKDFDETLKRMKKYGSESEMRKIAQTKTNSYEKKALGRKGNRALKRASKKKVAVKK